MGRIGELKNESKLLIKIIIEEKGDIPVMNTEAIYHHLTPQTYMKAWKHGNSSVYVVEKGTNGLGESKHTKRFGGIDNYHSIRAGSLFRTEENYDIFFKSLANYIVMIDDKAVSNTINMNDRFYDFDKWTIINANGDIVAEREKITLKDSILSSHVKDIEVEWDRQYENFWNLIKQLISKEVFLNPDAQNIPAIKRDASSNKQIKNSSISQLTVPLFIFVSCYESFFLFPDPLEKTL